MRKAIRHRETLAGALLTVLFLTATCGGEEEPVHSDIAIEEGDVSAVVAGNTRFALDLYARLAGQGNLFFSPYSISSALAMTYAGARANTETEMAAVLHLPRDASETAAVWGHDRVAAAFAATEKSIAADPKTRGYELHVANSLWGQKEYPFLETFLSDLEKHYGAGMNRVDFVTNAEGARGEINAWVEDRTREKIKDLIPPGVLGPATTLVLTNAIYFKGLWEIQFDTKATEVAPFHGERAETSVSLMRRKDDYRYLETEDLQVIELPYQGDGASMVVVLPRENLAGGLATVEKALTSERLDEWSTGLGKQEVTVHLPRFEMTWGTAELRDDLIALGMHDVFRGDAADLSGMDGTKTLFVSNVLHKAFVEVNEEGTEAAAATAVVTLKASFQEPTVFRADRPFLFLIRDTATGAILFMGRVTDLEG